MAWDDMAMKVKEAASKGMHVVWKEGTDAQIVGAFLDVRVKLTEDGIGGEYLGWCSTKRETDLKRIVAENQPGPESVPPVKKDDSVVTGLALVLRRCTLLEADRLSMTPDSVVIELGQVRRDLEVLHARALEQKR